MKQIKIKKHIATKYDKKLDITSFAKDGVPEHSVDLHVACPRCLAAEANKRHDGECS